MANITIDQLTKFKEKNESFELSTYNFFDQDEQLAGLEEEGGITEEHLKGLQRLTDITQNETHALNLYNKGLDSCFQVGALSKQQFIDQYQAAFGGSSSLAAATHERALARQSQLIHHYLNIKAHHEPHYKALHANNLTAATEDSYSKLPSYQDLFGGLNYCEVEECRTIFSPAAYLLDLIRFKEKQINDSQVAPDATLANRRPDLNDIPLDCENTNTVIPKLEIVNEVLVNRYASLQGISGATQQEKEQKVFQALSEVIYPFNLPFHLPLTQIRTYLKQLQTALPSIWKRFTPPGSEDKNALAIARETLAISPQEFTLYTTSKTAQSDIQAAYGLGTIDPLDQEKGLANIDVFLAKTGLSREALDQLLFGDLSEAEIDAKLNEQFFINIKDINETKAAIAIDSDGKQLTHLTLSRLDRIHRFIRLAHKINWSFVDLNWVLQSQGAQPDGTYQPTEMDDAMIQLLAHLVTWQKTYPDQSINALNTLIAPIKNVGSNTASGMNFFQQTFYQLDHNDKFQLGKTTWSIHDNDDTNNQLGTQLMAALGFSEKELVFIADKVRAALQPDKPEPKPELTLNIQALSALYRFSLITKLTHHALQETIELLEYMGNDEEERAYLSNLINIPSPLAAAATLNQLTMHFQWLQQAGVGNDVLQCILQEDVPTSSSFYLAPIDKISFINQLYQAIQPALLTQQVLASNAALQQEDKDGKPLATTLWQFLITQYQYEAEKIIFVDKNGLILTLPTLQTINEQLDQWLPGDPTSQKRKDLINDLKTTIQSLLEQTYQLQLQTNYDHIASQFRVSSDTAAEIIHCVKIKLQEEQLSLRELLLEPCFSRKRALVGTDQLPEKVNDAFAYLNAYSCLTSHFKLTRVDLRLLVSNALLYNIQDITQIKLPDLHYIFQYKQLAHRNKDRQYGFIRYFKGSSKKITLRDLIDLLQIQQTGSQVWKSLQTLGYIDQQGVIQDKFINLKQEADFAASIPATLLLSDAQKSEIYSLLKLSSAFVDRKAAAKGLATLTQWDDPQDPKQLTLLFNHLWPAETPEKYNPGYATLKGILQIEQCIQKSTQVGINVGTLRALYPLVSSTTYDTYAQAAITLLGAVQGKYNEVAWQEVFKPIQATLNELKRDALVAAVIYKLSTKPALTIQTHRDLYEYLLIDVDVSGLVETSRIKEAIGCLQLYVNRCRMNLEEKIIFPDQEDLERNWAWIHSYRVWEANRKTFLYPEDYIQPELRQEKTDLFQHLIESLQQTHIDKASVSKAVNGYLDSFAEVANLKYAGSYRRELELDTWQAPTPQQEAYFGYAVSLSSDGTRALVGAYLEDVEGHSNAGRAYVYAYQGDEWKPQGDPLQASNPQANAGFGHAVSLSSDGTRALVGARGEAVAGHSNAGRAYVYAYQGGEWKPQGDPLQAPTLPANANFGHAVSLSSDGTHALVGAPYEDVAGHSNAGRAYVYAYQEGTWKPQGTLQAPDPQESAYFGYAVSLSSDGTRALVGANNEDVDGHSSAGRAYVYAYQEGAWTLQQTLQAPTPQVSAYFGTAVSLSSDGTRALVGANYEDVDGVTDAGRAYVYAYQEGEWTLQQTLQARTPQASAHFGYPVSLSSDGTRALVGANNEDVDGHSSAGRAYVYAYQGDAWTLQQTLQAPTPQANAQFGDAVSLSSDGTRALVGASSEDVSGHTDAGQVYCFSWPKSPSLVLLNRTDTQPYQYYYRQADFVADPSEQIDRPKHWSPWTKINLTIPAKFASPIYAFGKLFVFWVEIKPGPNDPDKDGKFTKKRFEATIHYSFYQFNKDWVAPQTVNEEAILLPDTVTSQEETKKLVWQRVDVALALEGKHIIVRYPQAVSGTSVTQAYQWSIGNDLRSVSVKGGGAGYPTTLPLPDRAFNNLPAGTVNYPVSSSDLSILDTGQSAYLAIPQGSYNVLHEDMTTKPTGQFIGKATYIAADGQMGDVTDDGEWNNPYAASFPFNIGDRQFFYAQDLENNHWFIRELLANGQMGKETTAKGEWNNPYAVSFPFNIEGKQFYYAQNLENNHWYIQELLANGQMGKETASGNWTYSYAVSFPFNIGGRQFYYAQTTAGNYWYIQELLANGQMGKETASGNWTYSYAVSFPFNIGGRQFYYAQNINQKANKYHWYIQELLPGGKLGAETDKGDWDNPYRVSFPFNIGGRQFYYAQNLENNHWFIRELLADGKMGEETANGDWNNPYAVSFPFNIGSRQFFYVQNLKTNSWFIRELLLPVHKPTQGPYVQLTDTTKGLLGNALEYTLPLGDRFVVDFEFWIGGGTGADAIYFYAFAQNTPSTEESATGGYIIAYREYNAGEHGWDPDDLPYIGIQYGGGKPLEKYIVPDAAKKLDNSTWRQTRIIFNQGTFEILLDGELILWYTDPDYSTRDLTGKRWGFGARTGLYTDYHLIRAINVNLLNPSTYIRLNSTTIHALSRSLFAQGVEGLLSIPAQLTPEDSFTALGPQAGPVATPYPAETLDLEGANGLYYWELFFHAPFLVANQFNTHQQFELAQAWYQYLYNPTIDQKQQYPDTGASQEDHYWRFVGLRSNHNPTLKQELQRSPSEELKAELTSARQIDQYHKDPFEPHAIAALRPIAYQKTLVMHYVDNLLDWGDALFRQNTRETLVEATMHYVTAYDLLGKKPADLGKCALPDVRTLGEIRQYYKGNIPEFLIQLENHMRRLPLLTGAQDNPNNAIPNIYFGIPENKQFIAYWDRVQGRLYNIRHNLTLDGQPNYLPLFQPPINPAQLIQAVAAGAGVSSAVAAMQAPVPYYRFTVMLEKAKNATNFVIQLGGALLRALEQKDAEQLALLRTTHEQALLAMTRTIKQDQQKAAQETVAALKFGLAGTKARLDHYTHLISQGYSDGEIAQLALQSAAMASQGVSIGFNGAAIAGYLLPDTFGFSNGGMDFGTAIAQGGVIADKVTNILSQSAGLSATVAQYQRRAEDWELQKAIAQDDRDQIGKQIEAAQVQVLIADQELQVLEQNISQTQAIVQFLQTKFSDQEQYLWMVGQLATLYFQAYQLAHQLTLAAQRAWQFEKGHEQSVIHPGYWDNLHQGLLAGEALMLGLMHLEKSYMDQDVRCLEIVKTISLRALLVLIPDPSDKYKTMWDKFKDKGECTFDLDEKLFDLDYPGHYCRQIQTLSLSFPAVLGPYQNIHATLTQMASKTVLQPDENTIKKLLGVQGATITAGALRTDVRANQQIALSQGVNDSGLFELTFQDARYLPFEGTGAVSSWELSIPPAANPNVLASLTDVIITLRYTALAGDQDLKDKIKSIVYPASPSKNTA